MLDFNGDNKPDYLLVNAASRQTAIWHLNGVNLANAVFGPRLLPQAGRWKAPPISTAMHIQHHVLFRAGTRNTALESHDATFVGSALGPTLPSVSQLGISVNQNRPNEIPVKVELSAPTKLLESGIVAQRIPFGLDTEHALVGPFGISSNGVSSCKAMSWSPSCAYTTAILVAMAWLIQGIVTWAAVEPRVGLRESPRA